MGRMAVRDVILSTKVSTVPVISIRPCVASHASSPKLMAEIASPPRVLALRMAAVADADNFPDH
jgi:hypothetical protein